MGGPTLGGLRAGGPTQKKNKKITTLDCALFYNLGLFFKDRLKKALILFQIVVELFPCPLLYMHYAKSK